MHAIKFPCPSCRRPLSAPAEFAGKGSRCRCGAAVIVPNVAKVEFDFNGIPTARATAGPETDALPPRHRRHDGDDREPPTAEELLERIARRCAKEPSKSARTASVVAWIVCGMFLASAWLNVETARSRGNGGVGVGDISYAIFVSLTGYIVARIAEKAARAIG